MELTEKRNWFNCVQLKLSVRYTIKIFSLDVFKVSLSFILYFWVLGLEPRVMHI